MFNEVSPSQAGGLETRGVNPAQCLKQKSVSDDFLKSREDGVSLGPAGPSASSCVSRIPLPLLSPASPRSLVMTHGCWQPQVTSHQLSHPSRESSSSPVAPTKVLDPSRIHSQWPGLIHMPQDPRAELSFLCASALCSWPGAERRREAEAQTFSPRGWAGGVKAAREGLWASPW